MRPSGVTSKNVFIGARSTLANNELCRYLAAPKAPTYSDSVEKATDITVVVDMVAMEQTKHGQIQRNITEIWQKIWPQLQHTEIEGGEKSAQHGNKAADEIRFFRIKSTESKVT